MTAEKWNDDRIVLDISIKEAAALRQAIIDASGTGAGHFWGTGGGYRLNADLYTALGEKDPVIIDKRAYPLERD